MYIIYQDGNLSKSSQKLRHPVASPGAANVDDKNKDAHDGGKIHSVNVGEPKLRSRKLAPGPKHSRGQLSSTGVRLPTAPLQLRWFAGNQVTMWSN